MMIRSGLRAVALGVAALAWVVPAAAQPTVPAVSLRGGLSGRQPLEVRVVRPSYVTVFAVGRSTNGNLIQLLSSALGESRTPKAGRRFTPRALTDEERQLFALTDETVVIAIASSTQPRLDTFLHAADAPDRFLLLPDSIVSDGNRLIGSLAGELFAANTDYAAVIRQDFVPYVPPSIAAWPVLTREPAESCAPGGLTSGLSIGDLQQANSIGTNAFSRALDMLSGGNPYDESTGTAWKVAGTQLRNGCAEFTVIPYPIRRKDPLRPVPDASAETRRTTVESEPAPEQRSAPVTSPTAEPRRERYDGQSQPRRDRYEGTDAPRRERVDLPTKPRWERQEAPAPPRRAPEVPVEAVRMPVSQPVSQPVAQPVAPQPAPVRVDPEPPKLPVEPRIP